MHISFKDSYTIIESVKLARQYVDSGKLSDEDFETIKSIDPTPTKKFTGWVAKQWILGQISEEDKVNIKSLLEEFLSFATKRKTQNADIYQYKTFSDVKNEIDHLNNIGSDLSNKDLEKDFEVVRDDDDLLVISPHTHEASRKLGLTHFAYRECPDGGGTKDSSWCVTYKSPNHFNDYYFKRNVTFYFIKVKSADLQDKLINAGYDEKFFVTAIAVIPDNPKLKDSRFSLEAYDGTDTQFKGKQLKTFLDIIDIS